jgi:RNA recognition motif-containing protein
VKSFNFREENAKKVYVGGIPYYSTEDDIKSFFEGCGTITEIDCMKFPETGKFRGIAILTFKVCFFTLNLLLQVSSI